MVLNVLGRDVGSAVGLQACHPWKSRLRPWSQRKRRKTAWPIRRRERGGVQHCWGISDWTFSERTGRELRFRWSWCLEHQVKSPSVAVDRTRRSGGSKEEACWVGFGVCRSPVLARMFKVAHLRQRYNIRNLCTSA